MASEKAKETADSAKTPESVPEPRRAADDPAPLNDAAPVTNSTPLRQAAPSQEAGQPAVVDEEAPDITPERAAELLGWRRLSGTGLLTLVLAIGATAAGAAMIPSLAGRPSVETTAPAVTEPTETFDPIPTDDPSATASSDPSGLERPASAFTAWAAPLAGPLGIPQVALEAYGYAEWVLQQTRSTCKLQWTTLAAIGKVTSDHGKLNGSSLDPLGRERPALIGPALNGTGGNPRVDDTDGGALDLDQRWDHAIGPMQFTPAMWRASGVDADSDDIADPQDIDDATLAAAYHLCVSGQDLSVVANWKAAVATYHGLAPRIDKIFEEAQSYGVRSRS